MEEAKLQQFIAQREAGERAINEAIPEFSTKHKDAVIAYAIKQGVPEAAAKEQWSVNPFGAITAYKAMRYDEMQAKAKTKTKPGVKQTAVPSKPRKGKGGTVSKDPGKMTAEEYRRNYEKEYIPR